MKVRIAIDGRVHMVEAGRDLLSACLSEGIDVPHFCWHGSLGSVGACRLCAVRVHEGADDEAGRIDMACMVPAAEGRRVAVDDPEAAAYRAHVIEWLMVNHPHDCAVCEEGGACHLQDMTLLSGHVTRRYRFAKRTHRNQWLGPLLTHEMNRCIACYRCTRFYRGYAGGRDLDVFGAHDRVYFGRAEDGVLESPFAGNLAEICPTGVFNDKGWSRDYARKWDMMATPSVCPHCSVGCNVFLAERHDRIRRVQNRYHGAINGHFLCDRGRFGPLFAAAGARLSAPAIDGADADERDALDAARAALAEGAVGIGSPRASLEGNLALARLVGPARFFAGVADREARLVARMTGLLGAGPARIAALKDIETADAALVLGEDLTGTAPRAALALRQTARNAARALAAEKGVPDWLDNAVRYAGEGRTSPIAIVTALPDALDDVAAFPLRRAGGAIAAFGFAVAAALRGEPADEEPRAVAAALSGAAAPVVVAGAGADDPDAVEAAAAVAAALGEKARLALFPPEANALGLALLLDGLAGASREGEPSAGEGGRTARDAGAATGTATPGDTGPDGRDADGGRGLEAAVAALEAGRAKTAIVLENDLFERADAALVERLFAAATRVVVLDSLATRTTARAGVVLPVACFAEAAGSFVNHEGRAQRFFAAVPKGPTAAWRVLQALAPAPFGWESLDDVIAALGEAAPRLADVAAAAPGGAYATPLGKIARAPWAFSGRTASDEAGRVAPGTPPDPDSPLAFTMEGARGADLPPAVLAGYEGAHLHSASAVYRVEAVPGGPLKGGDPGVRLLDGGAAAHAGSATAAPPAGTPAPDPATDPVDEAAEAAAGHAVVAHELVRILRHDPFVGDETDRASPLLAERAPAAGLWLNPEDAAERGIAEGAPVRLEGAADAVAAMLDPSVPRGHVVVSPGRIAPRGGPRRPCVAPAAPGEAGR